ncbi:MAG: TadE/TadG family type IV pilus assembly protein [Pseudoclavibacter sp.]|nr:TadE/TadG family type IV pilus assembly protein [Pseudoclavibacter sp.]
MRGRDPAAGERGAAAAQAVLVLPATLLLFLGLVQGALLLHAGNVAQTAAQAAYEAARLADGDEAAGQRAAERTVAAAGDALQAVSVSVQRRGGVIRVTVAGTASGLLPGAPVDVVRRVEGPAERWEG